ncbi:MAG TPA: hybrid sensor histidine kinase/response regulator [Proteobacteria bacterium]|nr:hybrid sensor histidine kinase/response regulator [Pseudomonadota bacterium]
MKEGRVSILIIEDSPTDITIITRQLAKYGFDLDFATSGEDALKSLQEKKYDMVVTDYSMPGMTGLDVLDRMKKEGYDMPTVIMTGAGSERLAVEAMKKGACDYLIKSTDPGWLEVFPSVIQSNIEKYRLVKERRKIEEEKKQLAMRLQQAQKMESIGTLAGGIAHDFNNLLMGIMGHISLMLLRTDSDPQLFEHLKAIEDIVQKGSDLTKQLLGFARGGKYEVKLTDLNGLIEKTLELFGRTKKEMRIHSKYQKGIWPVEVDRGQIEQVLLNLYVNAWEATPGGGEFFVETSNVVLDKNYIKPFAVRPGHYVKISVTDTGVGMDKATQKRIFEPFFTTKEMGRGAGLGLASAYGIIKNHGGMINVYSEIGHGTTFNVYLPASEKDATVFEEHKVAEEILKGTETVLIVDDEAIVLDVCKDMLTEIGYKVLVARSGREAVEIYGKQKEEIDLVILDMIMPDMGGGEAYDRIKEMHPKAKVLLSSGYSIDGEASEILARGCNGFIQKPFNIKELYEKIRALLQK